MQLPKVIFLDRDGVINQDSSAYIKNWDEFYFLPGSLEALNQLTREDFTVIVITNQSIINRGMVPLDVLQHTHANLKQTVARTGGRIHDIFFCPHRPDENCDCRKPKPGLIRQACQRYDIDIHSSIMIGDNAKDILCGRNAGCGTTILVKTGNGAAAARSLAQQQIQPTAIAADLLQATQWIVSAKI